MSRIVLIGPAHPFRGGLAAFNERLATEFINLGHEVQLVTFTVQYPTFLFPGESQINTEPAPSLTISRWIHSFNPLNWPIAARKIKRLNPDFIVCKYWLPLMGPCFGSILRLAKTPNSQIVCILDNVIPHEKRPGDVLFTKFFLKPIDRFIYMSHKVGNDLKLFEKNKPAKFIPHPIYDNYGEAVDKSIALSRLNLSPDFQYVLFFGFIRDYKGLDLLFQAISLLGDQLPKVKFIIAGEFYTDKTPYFELISRLGIESRLILHTHFINDSEVKNYFSACDLVVQPYKSATQSGIAQIAIHFCKPTVVTKVGGLHEIIHHMKSGYVVNPDAESIYEAIKTYFSTANTAEMIMNVAEERKKYEWKHLAGAVLNK